MSNVIPFNATIHAPDWCATPLNGDPDIWFKSDSLPDGLEDMEAEYIYVGNNDAIRQIWGEYGCNCVIFLKMASELEAMSHQEQASIWWLISEGYDLESADRLTFHGSLVQRTDLEHYAQNLLEDAYDEPCEEEKDAAQKKLGCVETAMKNWATTLIENQWIVDNDEIDLLLKNDQRCFIMKQRYGLPDAEDMTAEQLQLAVQVLLCSYRFSHLAKLSKVMETCQNDDVEEFVFDGVTYIADRSSL